MKPLPNYAKDATVDIKFNVFDSNGEPGALTGTLTGSVTVYKTGNPTAHTQAYTPTVLDSLTGVYQVSIDMSAHAFFEVGKDYTAILTGAGITASGTAVTNTIIGRWACQNQSANIPDGGITANTFDAGVLATDADIADAVWDEQRAGHTTADTFGEGVASVIGGINTGSGTVTTLDQLDTNLSNDIGALNDLDSSAVAAACTSSLNAYDPPTRTEATSDKNEVLTRLGTPAGASVSADVAAIVADTNELQTDWANGGRLDLILDTAAAAGGAPTAAQIADAVWDEATSGHTSAGTFGEQLKTDVDAILADTNELQTDWANGGRLDLILDTAATGVTVSTAQVSNERTWYGDDYRARNIVSVGNGFVGVLAVMPDLNPETAIASVSAVTISGPTTVTATNLAVRADRMAAHFTVPALTTSGTYTIKCTVITADSQTIPTTCTLKVV